LKLALVLKWDANIDKTLKHYRCYLSK